MMGQWAGWFHSNNRLLSLTRLPTKLKIEKPQPCGSPTYSALLNARLLCSVEGNNDNDNNCV